MLHRSVLPRDEMTVLSGIPVTTVPRTVFDSAAIVSRRQLENMLNEVEVARLTDKLSIADLLERYAKTSGRDLSASARTADPALQQLARLIGSHEAQTLAFVAKAKWLKPEELYYLGFHFAEKERAEKKFGGEMLRLVARRSPRSKLAKDARSKLRGEGLE